MSIKYHILRLAVAALFALQLSCCAGSDKKPSYLDTSAPIDARVDDLLGRMTAEEKISMLRTLAPPIERLGIDKYYHGNEALHGVVRPGRFTVFPQAIALGAMWNPELVEEISTAISDEARGRWNALDGGKEQMLAFGDLLTFWSPTVNMARDPRWGRTPETYGEDPFLSGKTGAAFVRGLQGSDPRYLKVVSTPKHFAGNNEEHNRAECDVKASEKILREYYLPAFEACVKEGGAASTMAAYNAINGVPCTCNEWLLTDVLRCDWGFDGYVVSDCGGVYQIWSAHNYTSTVKEAAALALSAGLYLECGDTAYLEPLQDALAEGLVSMEDIDRAAGRVLRSRMRLGLFDPASDNPYSAIKEDVIGCEKHRALALQAARESVVLLKNNGILPLEKNSVKKIAVLGINAAKCELGDYSGVPTIQPVSVLDGIRSKVGEGVEVLTAPWISMDSGLSLIEPDAFVGGVKAEYFLGTGFEKKTLERTEPWIFFEPDNQAPDPLQPVHHMSARWTADLTADIEGEYQFVLDINNGGYSMWLDGEPMPASFSKTLRKGTTHRIVVEFNHERDYCCLKLLWRKPSSTALTKAGLMKEAIEAAESSDVVVAVMGYNKGIEREGHDREILTLPADQTDYLKQIYAVNQNVILVLVAGSSISLEWEDAHLPAILDGWYGGEYAGEAVADILFGDYNPAGRLPLTFYRSIDQLPPFGDYSVTNGRTYKYFPGDPLYPFGYGQSYTDFEYSDLKVKQTRSGWDVKFKITNVGTVDGEEVAQVYVRMDDYEGVAPIKELKGFRRISVAAGNTVPVTIHIPAKELRWWSEQDGAFRYSAKTPHVMVGSSSADIRLEQ